jgi:hypothetical protein
LSFDQRRRESFSTSTVIRAVPDPAKVRTRPSSVENEDWDIDPLLLVEVWLPFCVDDCVFDPVADWLLL